MGNSPSMVPYGAHTSLLNTTLFCSDGTAVFYFIPFEISATAPLASDTEVFFTDIFAKADLGPSPVTLVSNTTIIFSTNASPPTFTLSAQRVISGDDTDLIVPLEGLATAGPFQMTNDFAHLKVANVSIQARNADEGYSYNCFPLEHVVVSTARSTLSSLTTAPANGIRASFPDTPVGSKSEVASLPVSCSGKSYNFTLQGTIPVSFSVNSTFTVSNVETFLATDVETQTAFVAQYGEQNNTDVPGIQMLFGNTSVQDVDVSRDFSPTDPDTSNPLSSGRYTDGTPQGLTIAAPRLGSLTKTFKAGSAGLVTAMFQSIAGTLYTTDGNSPFSCTSSSANALFAAPIYISQVND